MQGSLQRAYPYDIPPTLYRISPSSPPTLNLTVIPYINYQYGVATTGGTPYSQAYGELSYRFRSGVAATFNETYIGPNNTYAVPHLFYSNASLELPLTKGFAIQLAAENVFNNDAGWTSPEYGPNGPYPLADITITGGEQHSWKTPLPPRTIRTELIYRIP